MLAAHRNSSSLAMRSVVRQAAVKASRAQQRRGVSSASVGGFVQLRRWRIDADCSATATRSAALLPGSSKACLRLFSSSLPDHIVVGMPGICMTALVCEGLLSVLPCCCADGGDGGGGQLICNVRLCGLYSRYCRLCDCVALSTYMHTVVTMCFYTNCNCVQYTSHFPLVLACSFSL